MANVITFPELVEGRIGTRIANRIPFPEPVEGRIGAQMANRITFPEPVEGPGNAYPKRSRDHVP